VKGKTWDEKEIGEKTIERPKQKKTTTKTANSGWKRERERAHSRKQHGIIHTHSSRTWARWPAGLPTSPKGKTDVHGNKPPSLPLSPSRQRNPAGQWDQNTSKWNGNASEEETLDMGDKGKKNGHRDGKGRKGWNVDTPQRKGKGKERKEQRERKRNGTNKSTTNRLFFFFSKALRSSIDHGGRKK
jgi:hypothetical protein